MGMIEKLEKAGFKRWQKKDMDRMYISNKKLGLEDDRSVKTYIDLKDMKVHSTSSEAKEKAIAFLDSILDESWEPEQKNDIKKLLEEKDRLLKRLAEINELLCKEEDD